VTATRQDARIDAIIVATGAEVHTAMEAGSLLVNDGILVRVVSMPCVELFLSQPQSYQEHILPSAVSARVCVDGSESLVRGVRLWASIALALRRREQRCSNDSGSHPEQSLTPSGACVLGRFHRHKWGKARCMNDSLHRTSQTDPPIDVPEPGPINPPTPTPPEVPDPVVPPRPDDPVIVPDPQPEPDERPPVAGEMAE
jgi:hypothetical protein